MILFSPIGVFPVAEMTATDAEIAGILDRLKFWEGIKVYKDVTVGDALAVLKAMEAKDAAAIRAAVTTIASHAGYAMEAGEVDDIVAELMAKDWKGVIYETCDAVMKFLVKHGGYVPGAAIVEGQFQIAERKAIRDMTPEECRTWYADNKGGVRTAANSGAGKYALRNLPQILSALDGTMSVAEAKALDPDQVVKWLNRAIFLLTVASIIYPACGLLVTALKLILARYETGHPDVGLSMADFCEPDSDPA